MVIETQDSTEWIPLYTDFFSVNTYSSITVSMVVESEVASQRADYKVIYVYVYMYMYICYTYPTAQLFKCLILKVASGYYFGQCRLKHTCYIFLDFLN